MKSLAWRRFLVDISDALFLVPGHQFEEMLLDSTQYPLPRFAGTQTRMAEVLVELRARRVARVVRHAYSLLRFDSYGYFAAEEFADRQAILAAGHLTPRVERTGAVARVSCLVRFSALGNCWTPSPQLAQKLDGAVLGYMGCQKL
jgi:hypothetical protein